MRAVRGALAFLTRLPVGGGEDAWDAFRATPVAFVVAGYVVGALAALPLLLPLPVSATVALYLLTLYLVTGVTHVDGLADCGDAAAVHGAAADRHSALKDSQTGVGGALLATGATGFLSPIEGILQGAFAGIALGVAVIGFIVAFVASDRMDSIERDSEVSS